MQKYYTGRGAYFLVVTLADNDWIRWSSNGNRFTFRWKNLGLSEDASHTELLIAVSKMYPEAETNEIEKIAELISYISQEEITETIVLGFNEQKVEQVGYIDSGSGVTPDGIYLDIRWFDDFEITEKFENLSVLDFEIGFNLLSNKKASSFGFTLEFPDDDAEDDELLDETFKRVYLEDFDGINVLFQEVPKAKKDVNLLPKLEEADFEPPAILKKLKEPFELEEVEESFFTQEPVRKVSVKKDPGGTVFVFYGTNRNRTGKKPADTYYGKELGNLETGWLKVNIPPGHKVGKIERPKKILLQFRAKKKKHVIITDMLQIDEKRFYELLNYRLSLVDNSALIFIHGYNNSFAECAWRTAQISYDVNFRGITGFFSWPSAAKAHFYGSDIEYADASIPDFDKFVRDIVNRTGVEEIHFVAHSMGNRILTATISSLQKDPDFNEDLKKFRQLIMAAPDIDQDVFKRNILPYFYQVGIRRTLYASDRDKALSFAEWLRVKRPRLGDGGNSVFVQNGIDSIDASNINPPKWLDHSYVFETKPLLSDLKRIIYQNDPPDVRDLKSKKKQGIRYWMFPK